MRNYSLLGFTAIFLWLTLGCSQCVEPEVHAHVSVTHISRWINDDGLPLFRIFYDDGSIDLLPMSEKQVNTFTSDRAYHREMNPTLWDQAWGETRENEDSWQAFKDRYVELGGTMLFD